MFENGNLSSPIIIGQVNTSDEFAAIYKSGKTYPALPKAFQNFFKSSEDDTENESHAAKGGDTELPDKYKQDLENLKSPIGSGRVKAEGSNDGVSRWNTKAVDEAASESGDPAAYYASKRIFKF